MAKWQFFLRKCDLHKKWHLKTGAYTVVYVVVPPCFLFTNIFHYFSNVSELLQVQCVIAVPYSSTADHYTKIPVHQY